MKNCDAAFRSVSHLTFHVTIQTGYKNTLTVEDL